MAIDIVFKETLRKPVLSEQHHDDVCDGKNIMVLGYGTLTIYRVCNNLGQLGYVVVLRRGSTLKQQWVETNLAVMCLLLFGDTYQCLVPLFTHIDNEGGRSDLTCSGFARGAAC